VQYLRANPIATMKEALGETWFYISITALSFVKIVQQVVPASELGGPILIAQMAGKHLRSGVVDFIYFISLVSVNLGLLNLLPIPILDGGHLVFLSVEAIRKKPLGERAQIVLQQVALDTATRCSTIALTRGGIAEGEVLAQQSFCVSMNHSRKILKRVHFLLEEAGFRWSDVGLVAVGLGPGSFTGLRIGMATAKGISFAASLPLAGVSTLDALAATCCHA
ncbi:unnamed protein product, partial [Cyprideis torosa]